MRYKIFSALCVMVLACCMTACRAEENSASQDAEQVTEVIEDGGMPTYQSRLVSLGEYKGLSYTEESDRAATDEETQEEMEAILAWYEDGELTDEWVQENLKLDSVEAFRENTRKSLTEMYQMQARKKAMRELYYAVIETSEFEMDETDVNTQRNDYIWVYQQMAEEMGISYEECVEEVTGLTVEEFEANAAVSAEQVVQVQLVAEAIVEAEALDVEASYEEITADILREEGLDSVKELEKQIGGKSALLEEVRYRLVGQYLLEWGTVASPKEAAYSSEE